MSPAERRRRGAARLYLHAVLCALLVSWGIHVFLTSRSLVTAGLSLMMVFFLVRNFPGFVDGRAAELDEDP